MTANPDPLLHPCLRVIGQAANPNFGTCRSHPRAGHAQLMNPPSLHLFFAPNAPNTLQFPCFTFFCFFDSRLLTTHIRAKGACDVHNRGEALFCLPLRPRDSCILGLCNSHSEHRGRVTATKRMPDLYLWTTAMCLAMRRPRIAEGGWKTSTAL